MPNKLFPLFAYLNHWLKKEDGHSLQSPFVYSIYSNLVSFLKEENKGNNEIESFRRSLLDSDEVIEVLDLGAGSKKVNTFKRKVALITKYSTSSPKFAKLYQYFCSLTKAKHVIELGTCMGISSRYLAEVTHGKVFTFEGSKEIQDVAKRNADTKNIEFILGEIQQSLPEILKGLPQVDFALVDANHTYEGTMTSFHLLLEKISPQSIVAIGDIYWSKEMAKAWKEIKANPKVKLSLDFYECGILFFEAPGGKTDYVLSI
ncbi:class I SAM-dependent methyltransferase [Algoriphagus sp. YJ13C]|uniref:Class I SAM-dependent methyltransferase n=1 Tax=Algoriphagus pacificus TaxID=2811234 RepID=A0ABS3CKY6_9BACT|nr:class I SAM-dependent methyltransferase [Algoriphagus pacificus]